MLCVRYFYCTAARRGFIFFGELWIGLHILDADYKVNMSYVTSSSGGVELPKLHVVLEKAGMIVPGWAYASKKLVEGNKGMAALGVGLGIVAIMLMMAGWVAYTAKSGMTSQWLGARHPNEIRLSDNYARPRGNDKTDTFLGHGVGPEFVEQPNYVLGNEDLLRTALNKFNRLKAQGAQVSDWKTFWAAYRAENSDDLDNSMYDFGDNFDSKKLRGASIGTK